MSTETPATHIKETSTAIAEQLGETESGPKALIRRIVERLGAEPALALLREAQDIENNGGMILPDNSRRRTPGGVFFYLVRGRISTQDRRIIFPHFKKPKAAKAAQAVNHTPPAARATAPPAKAFDWTEFQSNLDRVLLEKGSATMMKISLVGRPGRITEQGDTIILTLQGTKAPSLPKGVPEPKNMATAYVCFIARKQWAKVAEAIKNPEDALVIEGFPAYEENIKGIVVYVQSVTTKVQKIAKQQAPVASQ